MVMVGMQPGGGGGKRKKTTEKSEEEKGGERKEEGKEEKEFAEVYRELVKTVVRASREVRI